jgi:hypothetical protein
MKMFRLLAWLPVWIVAILCSAWAFGAIYYDFPAFRQMAAAIFVLILLVSVIFVRRKLLKLTAVFAVFALVLLWWLTLKPSNDGPWPPDVVETAWAEINGDEVTINNVRNCDYRTETDFTTHWERRTVRLSQITGLDIAIMYWGSPYMAHPIASFRFADALPICFSIETRKRIGQEYSALRGLYRQYTLIYIVADERDSIRVRTNYRHGEDVYLYHVLGSPEEARERFLEYLKALNILNTHPLWYNAITTNCTTNIRTQRPILKRIPWDWRILVNGKADELLYERHLIATGGLPFAELKQRSQINERARAADQDPAFSRLIRAAVPQSD